MEKEYEKAIHHISALILAGKYDRASSILNHIAKQGINNSEITIMKSYCLKMKGKIGEAIELLESSKNQGPIINMALAQYNKEREQYQMTLEKLKKIEDPFKNEKSESLVSKSIKSLEICLKVDEEPYFYSQKFEGINIDVVNALNSVVEKYKKQKMNAREAKEEFLSIICQNSLGKKLETIVKSFIQYLDNEEPEFF